MEFNSDSQFEFDAQIHLKFVKKLYKASGRMETGRAINSIPLLLPKLSEHWFSYDDVDVFEKKIRTFEKRCQTEAAECLARKIDSVGIEDKRKYDVGQSEKKWIMKDISQKWKYHKYVLRRKFFKQSKKTVQMNPPEHLHISADMWKEAVKLWTSEHWVVQLDFKRQWYEAQFARLAVYAPHLVGTERLKANRFMDGLWPIFIEKLGPHNIQTYTKMVQRAQLVEDTMAKVKGMRGKDNCKPVFVKKGAPNTAPTFHNNNNFNNNNNKRTNAGRDNAVDKKVKVEGRQFAENCKFCDKPGHRAEEC
ncbi:hypothetical protein Taro_025704 [Colocasia esculenta]|uniref:CCHC-type domain-containing protein n=1 Tax=Colocasia esculenta TaxID=4460 RepID=A0A843VF07_COLES|nr:hypothetical protein [Colocasia esculenta]